MTHVLKAISVTQLPEEVESVVKTARRDFQALILVTGVFDILHQEHITFLHKAKELGGVLVVGLESDVRVRQIKGEGRPVNSEAVRAQHLMDLRIADTVFILPDTFGQPAEIKAFIHHVKPKYLAVSSHTPHLEVKRKLLAEVGGEVKIVHQHNPAVSTTQILAQK